MISRRLPPGVRAAAIAAALPALVAAYASGAAAGVSGVPGEISCGGCHSGTGTGGVTVSFPGTLTYTPGAQQHLVVSDLIVLWGTGFSATTPAVPPGVVPPAVPVVNVANSVSVTLGNLPVPVVSAAIAPGNPGLYQIAVQIPASAPDGDLAVVAQVSGVQSPAGALLSVKR